jgi:hypothetical protein
MIEIVQSYVFPAAYSFEIVDELRPSMKDIVPVPVGSVRDGLLLRLNAEDAEESWLARVRFGDGGISIVATTPSPHLLLVVASGASYLLDARHTGSYSDLETTGVTSFFESPKQRTTVLAEPLGFTAIQENGLAWTNFEITGGTLVDLALNADVITGKAWDPAAQSRRPFVLQVRSGVHEGGMKPLTAL